MSILHLLSFYSALLRSSHLTEHMRSDSRYLESCIQQGVAIETVRNKDSSEEFYVNKGIVII